MKIAMLFPGYPSQYVGMGKELYDEYRIIQEYFEEASHCLGINFVKLCFASSDAELARMANAWPALFLVSASIVSLLKAEGVEPDLVAGYNNGEYAAIYAAGGFTFPDGLYLLNKLTLFYQELFDAQDLAALRVRGIERDELELLIKPINTESHQAHIAIIESPKQCVVAGHAIIIDELVRELNDTPGAKSSAVDIEIGLHSPLAQSVVDQFSMYLEKVDFKDLQVPLVANIDGLPLEHGEQVRDAIIKRIYMPERFDRIINQLDPYDLILEIGPGSMISTMVKEKYPDKLTYSIEKLEDISNLKKLLPSHDEQTES